MQSFLPWILYFVLAGNSQAKLDLAIVAALIAFLIFDLKSLRKNFILSWGTLLFFVFMLITVVLMKNHWIALHAWVFSNGTLALIAWVSLFIGKPFTEQYAREQVEAKYWQTPTFININRILTAVWGSVFVFCVLVHVLKIYYPTSPNWIYETLSDGSTVMAIWFTTWFPKWYRQKAQVTTNG